jgi:hypothetical protein
MQHTWHHLMQGEIMNTVEVMAAKGNDRSESSCRDEMSDAVDTQEKQS